MIINIDEINENQIFLSFKNRLGFFQSVLDSYHDNKNIHSIKNTLKGDFIRIYGIDSILNFGKHQSNNLIGIIKEDPKYICFCIKTLDHFAISYSALTLLSSMIGLEDFKEVIIINTYKFLISDMQRRLIDLIKDNQRESIKVNMDICKLGMDVAFEGDYSNLWNID